METGVTLFLEDKFQIGLIRDIILYCFLKKNNMAWFNKYTPLVNIYQNLN